MAERPLAERQDGDDEQRGEQHGADLARCEAQAHHRDDRCGHPDQGAATEPGRVSESLAAGSPAGMLRTVAQTGVNSTEAQR